MKTIRFLAAILAFITNVAFAADEVTPQPIAASASSVPAAKAAESESYPVPAHSSPGMKLPAEALKPITIPDATIPDDVKRFSGAWEGSFGTNQGIYPAILAIHAVSVESFDATYVINGNANPMTMTKKGDGIYAGTLKSGRYLTIRFMVGDQLELNLSGTKEWFKRMPAGKNPA